MTTPEPDLINVVLSFRDERDGSVWLAGAQLGPLLAEHDSERRLELCDILDLPMVVTRFTVVRP